MGANIKTDSRVLFAEISGELDHHQAERLRTQIDAAYDKSSCRHIILNMAGVDFMDSSGIGMIIGRYKNTEKRGGKLILAQMSEHVTKLFEISGLAKIIKRAASTEDALNILNCKNATGSANKLLGGASNGK